MNSGKRYGVSVLAAGCLLCAGATGVAASERLPGQVAGLRITPVSDAAITAPIRNVHGRVQSIAGPVLTLRAGGREMTFMVDDNTDILARGASRATRHAGGGLPITDLVHTGDIVRLAYRELNGWMRVSEIQITGRNTIAAR
jgi:hypothetical protein